MQAAKGSENVTLISKRDWPSLVKFPCVRRVLVSVRAPSALNGKREFSSPQYAINVSLGQMGKIDLPTLTNLYC